VIGAGSGFEKLLAEPFKVSLLLHSYIRSIPPEQVRLSLEMIPTGHSEPLIHFQCFSSSQAIAFSTHAPGG